VRAEPSCLLQNACKAHSAECWLFASHVLIPLV
jgi:hypothetical protein